MAASRAPSVRRTPPRVHLSTSQLPPLPPLSVERRSVAFTHKSALLHVPGNTGKTAETLCQKPAEYMGDKALGLWVASAIAEVRFPVDSGVLSALIGSMLCNETLAQVARAYGMHNELKLDRTAEADGRRTDVKVLADTFESYMGQCWLEALKDGLVMGVDAAGRPRPFQAFRDYIRVFASTTVFPDLWQMIDTLMDPDRPTHRHGQSTKRKRDDADA